MINLSKQFMQFVKYPSLLVCLLCVTEPHASDLDIVLSEKEQQLVTNAEQQRQAENMIDMMKTLEKLTDYPDAAIEELTDNSASHQSLKKVIRALKDAKQKSTQEVNCNEKPLYKPSFNEAVAKKNVKTVQLKPIFARAEHTADGARNKVIFHSDNTGTITVYEGQSFKFEGKSYQLLSVQPTRNSGSSEFKSSEFKISLKTPDAIKQYFWPGS